MFRGKEIPQEIQAVLQIAGIFITLGIAIFGGILTGVITSLLIYSENEKYFRDSDLIKAEDIILPEYENDAYPDNNLNYHFSKFYYYSRLTYSLRQIQHLIHR